MPENDSAIVIGVLALAGLVVGVPMLVGCLQSPEPPAWRWPVRAAATAFAAHMFLWLTGAKLNFKGNDGWFYVELLVGMVGNLAGTFAIFVGSFTLGRWLGWRAR